MWLIIRTTIITTEVGVRTTTHTTNGDVANYTTTTINATKKVANYTDVKTTHTTKGMWLIIRTSRQHIQQRDVANYTDDKTYNKGRCG